MCVKATSFWFDGLRPCLLFCCNPPENAHLEKVGTLSDCQQHRRLALAPSVCLHLLVEGRAGGTITSKQKMAIDLLVQVNTLNIEGDRPARAPTLLPAGVPQHLPP